MDVRVLGATEIRGAPNPSKLGGAQQQAVLGLLVCRVGEPISVGWIQTQLWPDGPGSRASTVSGYLSDLRGLVGRDLLPPRTAQLLIDPERIDMYRFEQFIDEGLAQRSADPIGAVRSLRAALSEWRADPFATMSADVEALEATRHHLERGQRLALETLFAIELDHQNQADIVEEVVAATAAHPDHPTFWTQRLFTHHWMRESAEVERTIVEAEQAFDRARSTAPVDRHHRPIRGAVHPGRGAGGENGLRRCPDRAARPGRCARRGGHAGRLRRSCIPSPAARIMSRGWHLVGPMVESELHRAIVEPASQVGLRLEEGLAERIIADVGSEPGSLPLLSHALFETWVRRRGTWLTHVGYSQAGGVHGAMAQSADALLDVELDDQDRSMAKRILLRLVDVSGDGLESRRPLLHGELADLGPDAVRVASRQADARLVTAADDRIELAHEALLYRPTNGGFRCARQ